MLGSILVFLIVLSILILVHELGHFLMARRFGVWVEEFGFGIPPRIIGKKIGETLYSLNFLPFGGFVKLHGESFEEEITDPKRSFMNKSILERLIILVAGVVMNFLLAVVAFAVVYSFSGIPKETKDVRLVDIAQGSPAQIAGLIVGDIVKTVDKEKIESMSAFTKLIEEKKGKRVTLGIERLVEGQKTEKKVTITPRADPPPDEGPLGIVITTTEIYYPPIWQRPFVGAFYGLKDSLYWGKNVILGFAGIFTDLLGGKVPQDLSGPVGIFAITTQAAKMGILSVINFMGVLSINLAILNIIPFPALDGGRVLFVVIEKIMGRKVLPKVEGYIHTVGMIILLILILAITAHDIQRLVVAGSLSNFIESVLK
jgi:regulator of sigma E protease